MLSFHLDAEEPRVINRPAIVLGGINPSFIRASNTEEFLIGKLLSNVDDVNQAIRILGEEVNPQKNYNNSLPQFRRNLSQCLLYKAIISIIGDTVSPDIKSGGSKLERPVSSSEQTFDANEETWPVGKSIEKLESRLQISGEAEYLDDIPYLPGELHGYFVQSTIARGKIKSIDASKCLEMPGVVDFITAKDIPGKNTIFVFQTKLGTDQVFADTDIKFYGEAIGLVVAESRTIAKEASKLVSVTYENVLKPVLTIKEAMKVEDRYHKTSGYFGEKNCVASGDVEVNPLVLKIRNILLRANYPLEVSVILLWNPYAGRTVPTEEGYDLWCTTQWTSETVNAVASNLDIPTNSINISVRRLGGGYGGKISRANITASASAIAAHKLKKPVRVALDLSNQMTLVGWREPYYSKYKVGFSDEGLLQSVSVEICSDVGNEGSENSCFIAVLALSNVYFCPNWKIEGHAQATGILENIIERVAFELNKDPLEVRELNFISPERPDFLSQRNGENLAQKTIFPLLKTKAEIDSRRNEILKFNKENKWKKRGISVIPLHFPYEVFPFFVYNVQVVIYEYDGSVAIKHGGVEMGQGINIKVAQVAARILDIPLDLIKVKSHDNFANANSVFTAASLTSDINAHGVKVCCEKLRSRIDEVAEKHNIEKDSTLSKEHPKSYDIWGATCIEVELDILTGTILGKIRRCDIIEDCGRSLNPSVDVGQVEGAFLMGLGLFTSEEVKYNPETGQRLSNSTWEYKPPSALDIPVDFRVSLLPKGDNEGGVLGSKATGEPPLCMSYSVVTALRQAITSKRLDDGKTEWFEIDVPLTVERIHELCEIDTTQLVF
ncbi:Xanthine dehydrogenase [Armadillidium vulgare]|nr:Xanthine dehydrogenase [Armadillidium vulgare]